jgi:hypothetical protein
VPEQQLPAAYDVSATLAGLDALHASRTVQRPRDLGYGHADPHSSEALEPKHSDLCVHPQISRVDQAAAVGEVPPAAVLHIAHHPTWSAAGAPLTRLSMSSV